MISDDYEDLIREGVRLTGHREYSFRPYGARRKPSRTKEVLTTRESFAQTRAQLEQIAARGKKNLLGSDRRGAIDSSVIALAKFQYESGQNEEFRVRNLAGKRAAHRVLRRLKTLASLLRALPPSYRKKLNELAAEAVDMESLLLSCADALKEMEPRSMARLAYEIVSETESSRAGEPPTLLLIELWHRIQPHVRSQAEKYIRESRGRRSVLAILNRLVEIIEKPRQRSANVRRPSRGLLFVSLMDEAGIKPGLAYDCYKVCNVPGTYQKYEHALLRAADDDLEVTSGQIKSYQVRLKRGRPNRRPPNPDTPAKNSRVMTRPTR